MRALWTALFATLQLVGPAPAQSLEVGDVVRWSESPDLGGQRPEVTVVIFVPTARLPARRAERMACALRGRFGSNCLIAKCYEEAPELRGQLASSSDPKHEAVAAVLDAQGRLLAVVTRGVSLRILVHDVLAGRIDASVAVELADLDGAVHLARQKRSWDEVSQRVGRLREILPGHPAVWLAELQSLPGSSPIDRQWLAQALRALGDEPDRWVEFVHRVVSREAAMADQPAIVERVQRLSGQALRDGDACLAGFECAAARNRDDEASSFAFAYLECCKGEPQTLRGFAKRLARPALRERFIEVRLTAIELGLRSAPADADLLQRQLEVVAEDLGDWVAAARAARMLIDTMAGDARALNSFAWRLLTESPYQGHMQAVALEAALAMASDQSWRTYWRVDTLALAEFENGHLERAVQLQAEAVGECDDASRARYESRLQGYRRALEAVPRPVR